MVSVESQYETETITAKYCPVSPLCFFNMKLKLRNCKESALMSISDNKQVKYSP